MFRVNSRWGETLLFFVGSGQLVMNIGVVMTPTVVAITIVVAIVWRHVALTGQHGSSDWQLSLTGLLIVAISLMMVAASLIVTGGLTQLIESGVLDESSTMIRQAQGEVMAIWGACLVFAVLGSWAMVVSRP